MPRRFSDPFWRHRSNIRDVPRPQLHQTDTMLDATRDLLLESGTRAATIEAIAAASGAPIGTIYHRFGSRESLLTRLWMRAVYRSQQLYRATAEVSEGALVLRTPRFADGDDLCCPAKIVERVYDWIDAEATFKRRSSKELPGPAGTTTTPPAG